VRELERENLPGTQLPGERSGHRGEGIEEATLVELDTMLLLFRDVTGSSGMRRDHQDRQERARALEERVVVRRLTVLGEAIDARGEHDQPLHPAGRQRPVQEPRDEALRRRTKCAGALERVEPRVHGSAQELARRIKRRCTSLAPS
jgi:hypothetical protein